jgi:aminocarboxymuconate-semialdehyde decarboxylase
MLNDTINGQTFDAPELLPFWQAAEQLGALLFVHQGGPTVVSPRADRYHLPEHDWQSGGSGRDLRLPGLRGVMDQCPDLKVCLAHGGGYTCFGIGRMDRGWQVRAEARAYIQQPPSTYLRKFYYDCLTHSEAALRLLIDTVGIDRVVFGTDWPADMAMDWPVAWVLSLESLTPEEKEAICIKIWNSCWASKPSDDARVVRCRYIKEVKESSRKSEPSAASSGGPLRGQRRLTAIHGRLAPV